MTFLQPLILWGLPLLLIPLVIHLLNRLRYRSVNWGAMMFVLKVNRSSTNMARVKQYLILLFRMLAVALLVLAIARPLIGGWLGMTLSGPPDTVVILLDRSASMAEEYPDHSSRLHRAIANFKKALSGYSRLPRLVLIDSATRKPREIPSLDVLDSLPESEQSESAADISAMLSDAVDYLTANRTGNAEIWLASDLQRSNWRSGVNVWEQAIARLAAMPERVRVRLLSSPSGGQNDLSISVVEVVDHVIDGRDSHEVVFEIRQRVPGDGTVPVTFSDGTNSKQIKVDLSTETTRTSIKLPNGSGKTTFGFLSLPADQNPANNKAYFACGKRPDRVVNCRTSDRYVEDLLKLAVAVPSLEPKKDRKAALDWQKLSLLIIQENVESKELENDIAKYLAEGGVVLCLPPENGEAIPCAGIKWGATEVAGNKKSFQVVEWRHRGNITADTASGEELGFDKLKISKRRCPEGELETLASYSDGKPFLSRKRIGKGNVYVLSTLPISAWSDLADGILLVPLLQRLAREGEGRLGNIRYLICGKDEVSPDWRSITEGRDYPQWQTGIFGHEGLVYVINRPVSEDESGFLSEPEVRDLFGDVPLHIFQEEETGRENLMAEGWRQVCFLMLLFLVGEALMCLPPKVRASLTVGGVK